jgi:hypothetical protein
MITLLKTETTVRAIRDVYLDEDFLPKGWIGRIIGITELDGEAAIHVRGNNPETGRTESFYYLDPRGFVSELPQRGELKLVVTYHSPDKGDVWSD